MTAKTAPHCPKCDPDLIARDEHDAHHYRRHKLETRIALDPFGKKPREPQVFADARRESGASESAPDHLCFECTKTTAG
jgi:hypothetical protein